MEGQNRTAANAGKLCSNISIGIMVDYSFEKNVCSFVFVCMSNKCISFNLCPFLCPCRCLWSQRRGTETSTESKNWRPASQS